MASKNLCGKTVKPEDAYEVWKNGSGWTWYVLKKYQSPEQEALNPYARWFCLVKSPFVPDGELGDTYVRDIKGSARLVSVKEPETAWKVTKKTNRSRGRNNSAGLSVSGCRRTRRS
jgi:hypothetical protein